MVLLNGCQCYGGRQSRMMRVEVSNGEWFTTLNNMKRVDFMKNSVCFISFPTISPCFSGYNLGGTFFCIVCLEYFCIFLQVKIFIRLIVQFNVSSNVVLCHVITYLIMLILEYSYLPFHINPLPYFINNHSFSYGFLVYLNFIESRKQMFSASYFCLFQ